MKSIEQVAIVGGIHGNEVIGAHLIQKFERYPELIQRTTLNVIPLLGNPRAFAACKRYMETDLNRCFQLQDLQDPTRTSYEDRRAKQIYQLLRPAGQPHVDVIVDLHSTTANMGLTLILGSYHPFNLQLAAYLSTISPLVKVFSYTEVHQSSAVLRSLCELGLAIEVGAVAQGVLQAERFAETEALVHAVLNYLEAYNNGIILPGLRPLILYEYVETIDYPRTAEGEITAMIHPLRQGQDYQPLQPGDPLFLTFDYQVISYHGEPMLYPVFVNEAAYYEKGIAMYLTRKREVTI